MSTSFLTFLDRAVSMIELGVPVVPLPPCKKSPPPKGWQDLATTDIEIIKGWLVANGQPAIAVEDSNCACVSTPTGVWFLDIDNMKAVSEQIEKETGHKLQEIMTLVVRSSAEKRHMYFKQNEASRALGNVDYDGPDGAELCSVRVSGKYVVSPFSVHPDTGSEYEITRKMDIIEAPVWLIDWLRTAKRSNGERKENLAANDTAKIFEGGRDDFLFGEACKLRDAKMSQKAALAALLVVNQDRCEPPMPDSVVKIKIKSAYTREAREKHTVGTFVESGTSPTKPKSLLAAVGSKTVNLKRANEVVTKKIQWLWRHRVPLGKLTMFVGDPDNGKSMAASDVAAAGTTQRDWADGRNEIPPYEVLMLVGEDDIEDTTVPRLQAAGANLSKVHFLESVTSNDGPGKTPEDREFQFDTDLKEIEKVLESNPNIRLLVIDPVSNYLGRTRMVNEQEVRAILIPLKKLAAKMNIAVLGVMHLNKKSELNAINRVGGAMAFVGVARATWLFVRDPEDFDKLQMLRVKCNIAKRSGGLLFTIGVKPIEIEGSAEWAPYIQWGAETEATANDVLRPKTAVGRPREERSEAAKWLGEYLAEGAQPQKEVEEQGNGLHDFSKATLRRAKKEIGAHSFQKERQWFWELPRDPDGGDQDRL